MGLLEGYRALDLMDEKGYYCGKILADFGVEVIKVERPGGDPGRNIGPFYGDVVDPERSLYWWAFNTNKKGITLNIEDSQGQELFKRLVAQADFLLESFAPGYMDRIDLGYPVLKEINPRLVYTTVTPFGQKGPYKDYLATDIVACAMSGVMSVLGPADRPPLRWAGGQAYGFACALAAVGTIIAHYHRELTGEGQRVDVGLVDSLTPQHYSDIVEWEQFKTLPLRGGVTRLPDGTLTQGEVFGSVWPCKDGYVTWSLGRGTRGATTNRELVQWMEEEGYDVGELKHVNWEEYSESQLTPEQKGEWLRIIGGFLAGHTKEELALAAQKRKVRFSLEPVSSIPDVLKNEQLEVRGFWSEIEHEDLGLKLRYPGQPFVASETENRTRVRAPRIGEHNELVYGQQLKLSAEEIAFLKEAGII